MKSAAPFAVALTAILLAQHPAQAQHAMDIHVRTAGDLAALCGANPGDPMSDAKIDYCEGFAQGAVDVELGHAGSAKPFCLPSNVKREATLREFASWVRAVASRGSDDATSGLFRFLAERYSCK